MKYVTVKNAMGTSTHRFPVFDEETRKIGYRLLCAALGLKA